MTNYLCMGCGHRTKGRLGRWYHMYFERDLCREVAGARPNPPMVKIVDDKLFVPKLKRGKYDPDEDLKGFGERPF